MHHGVPTKTPTTVLTGNLTVHTKMHTKVCSVNFHMSYFHMFCFLPRKGNPHAIHGVLDVSNRAIRITARAILDRLRIDACDFKPILQVKNSKTLTAIRTVIGFAIQIVRFEIAANRWRFELLRTANCDSNI